MREILFRGFHKDESGKEKVYVKGEWIKGYWVEGGIYYQKSDEVKEEAIYIIGGSLNDVGCAYEVIPETVGQYTGLKDNNGKKIFKGDIVKYGDTVHQVVFEQRNGTAYFGLVYNKFETLPFGHYQDSKLNEVIGNIHSNPELLEV